MANRAHLVPTPITDSLGRQTTVYRRPEAVTTQRTQWTAPAAQPTVVVQHTEWVTPGEGGAGRPNPPRPQRMSPFAETYAQRMEYIKAANEWRSFEKGADYWTDAVEAAERFQRAIPTSRDDLYPEAESLGWRVETYRDEGDWARLATAGKFVDAYTEFAGVGARYYTPGLSTTDWAARDSSEEDDDFIYHASAVFEVYERLHDLDLLDASAVPEGEDAARFMAHLYARADRSIDYEGVEFDHTEHIRLLDEHYRHIEEIIRLVREDQTTPAQQIRALIEGDVAPGLTSGAL